MTPTTLLRLSLVTGLAVAALMSATPAIAHVQDGQAQGFASGLWHPISGLDHVLAMVAVGLWGAQLGAPALLLLPVTFPVMMAFGGFIGLIGISVPGVEIGIALSAFLLGLLIALEVRPPLAVAMIVVGIFAIFHGHAHGTELPAGQSALMYSIGFVIATGCLHGLGILIGAARGWRWGNILLRMSGAFVAFAGSVFLWRALA